VSPLCQLCCHNSECPHAAYPYAERSCSECRDVKRQKIYLIIVSNSQEEDNSWQACTIKLFTTVINTRPSFLPSQATTTFFYPMTNIRLGTVTNELAYFVNYYCKVL
jgi:hypothetical protein